MENKDFKNNNLFFCYSNRLMKFLKIFGIDYLNGGVNKNNNNRYYVYEKNDKLKQLLIKWNEIKKVVPLNDN